MPPKLPKTTLNLKQFILRQEALTLYRDIFKTLRKVKDESTKAELKEWARTDFRNNMHHTDEITVKALIRHGKKSLKDLQNSLALSGNDCKT